MGNTATRVCPWWMAYLLDNPLRRLVHPAQATLAPYVRPGMKTADLGCGFGHYSLGLARIVGENGCVWAMDVQHQMLHKTIGRARKQRLDQRIRPVMALPHDLGIGTELDFVLAANMLHEVPDKTHFLGQVYERLKSGGLFYVMEPRGHVTPQRFAEEIGLALAAGFHEMERPSLWREQCVVLIKPSRGANA